MAPGKNGNGKQGKDQGGQGRPAHPHDAMFRLLMDNPEYASAVVLDHLPQAVLRMLNGTPPRLVDGTFVSDELGLSQSDRLFELDLKGDDPPLLYVLLEHKSAPDPLTALQILNYAASIWERYRRRHPQARRFPLVVPMVIYNGARPWNAPLSMSGLIPHNPEEHPWMPALAYLLLDLGKMDDDKLSSAPEPAALLKTMKYAPRGEALAGKVIADIWQIVPGGLKMPVAKYILGVSKVDQTRLIASLAPTEREKLEAIMGSILEETYLQGEEIGIAKGIQQGEEIGRQQGEEAGIAKGRQQGEEVGIAKGIQQGELATKSANLIRLLQKRFGPLPESVRERIEEAPVASLDAWFDAAIDAESLRDVFGA